MSTITIVNLVLQGLTAALGIILTLRKRTTALSRAWMPDSAMTCNMIARSIASDIQDRRGAATACHYLGLFSSRLLVLKSGSLLRLQHSALSNTDLLLMRSVAAEALQLSASGSSEAIHVSYLHARAGDIFRHLKGKWLSYAHSRQPSQYCSLMHSSMHACLQVQARAVNKTLRHSCLT